MNIMLVGAAGYVGRFVLKELLNRNIKVTAVIKPEENIKLKDFNLRIEKKEILDPSLEKIMEQNTVVILSGIFSDKSSKEQKLAYKSIISKMKDAGKKKLLILYEINRDESEIIRDEIVGLLKSEKEIEWSMMIVPKNLETGDKKGKYSFIEYKKEDIYETLFIEDIASAVVDEVEKNNHIKKEFIIKY